MSVGSAPQMGRGATPCNSPESWVRPSLWIIEMEELHTSGALTMCCLTHSCSLAKLPRRLQHVLDTVQAGGLKRWGGEQGARLGSA